MLFSWVKRQEHQDAGHPGRLDASDLHLLRFELSEEERKPWNKRAVDLKRSNCPKVLAAHMALVGAISVPPPVVTAVPGVAVLSESEMAKYYQLQLVQRDAVACASAVIVAWWKKVRRPSGDLKELDKLGIDLATSLAAIDLAPHPVDLVVKDVQEPMEVRKQMDRAAGDFILPLSPTSPSNVVSHNPPQPRSPLLIHRLLKVPKVTCNGERLGDDAMGVQGSRVSLAGVLAGGVV